MKHYQPVLVFLMLVSLSIISSIDSYRYTEQAIDHDMQQALAQTLKEERPDVITTDTIRTFNRYLQINELRGKALLTLACPKSPTCRDSIATTISTHCPAIVVLRMSDLRSAMTLASMALLWAVGCGVRSARRRPTPQPALPSFGGLQFAEAEDRFFDLQHNEVRFTPMQRQLMALFFHAPCYRLTKTDICETLWPKKDDASETLYTLVRRLKTTLEAHSSLTIESDRGRAYALKEH